MSPGPWKVARSCGIPLNDDALEDCDVIQDANGHCVARMMAPDDPDSSLIAAAPRLRDALAAMVRWSKGGMGARVPVNAAQSLLDSLDLDEKIGDERSGT